MQEQQDDRMTLEMFQAEGLLTQEQCLEIQAWFRASCRMPEGLSLPEHLVVPLLRAELLHNLPKTVMH